MKSLLIALTPLALSAALTTAEASEPLFSHQVFFELKNNDAPSKQALIDGCYKYLEPHEGILAFSAGSRAEEMSRDVNVTDYDVSLLVIFVDKAAHDVYQGTDEHKAFIAELDENWESVRVFDSYVDPEGLKIAAPE